MAIGDGIRARNLARRALAAYETKGWAGAAAEIAPANPRLAPGAWAELGVALENEGHRDDARRALAHSRELAPDRIDTLLFVAELERDAGDAQAAIGHYRELLARRPDAAEQAIDLARLLEREDAHEEIVALLSPLRAHPSIELRLLLARGLFALSRHADVLEVLKPAMADAERELHGFVGGGLRDVLITGMREASSLHDDAYAALHGRERVIEAAAARGHLDARAGVNYRLLGEARMAEPPAWTADTTLRDVAGTTAFGEALIGRGERSRGLCHLGMGALRRHDASAARRLFESARDADDGNFAAYLGIGAALDHDRSRAIVERARLPAPPDVLPPALAQVFVDWPALTSAERIAVYAAAFPLARQLPAVAQAGAVARVLPIDARLVDLPAFAAGAGERLEDDDRCLDAITGAATDSVCAAKIEELLLVGGDHGWVFAHELAHLVHFHLPEAQQQELEELFATLSADDFVLTTYQMRNSAEFFAVAYEDYLCERYELPSPREAGTDHIEPVLAFIDRLG